MDRPIEVPMACLGFKMLKISNPWKSDLVGLDSGSEFDYISLLEVGVSSPRRSIYACARISGKDHLGRRVLIFTLQAKDDAGGAARKPVNRLRRPGRGTAVTMPATPPFIRPPTAIMPSFCRTSVISAKFQKRHRRSLRNDLDDDSDKMGGVGFAVLTVLDASRLQRKGDSSDLPLPRTSPTGGAPRIDGRRDRQKEMLAKKSETGSSSAKSTSLSGRDVLLALQSASAHKASVGRRRRGSKQKGTVLTEESRLNPEDIRPIIIMSDWAVRLRKLESLLEELTMDDV